MADWQETGSTSEGVTIAFEGINQDEQDKLDMENFARGVKTPAKEDPGGKAFATTAAMGRRAMTPMDAVRTGLAAALAFAGYQILSAAHVTGGGLTGGVIGGAALGYALPSIIDLFRAKRAAAVTRSTADSFRLTLSPAELVVEGQTTPRQVIPVEAIDHFSGIGRLTVHRRDGTAAALPCSLKHRMHGPLAARLDELLREAKAAQVAPAG
jgi:hypothetical protein